ncbi:MAG: MotA/TolQ/ExbB proton channel family protein [Roseovarius sp.]
MPPRPEPPQSWPRKYPCPPGSPPAPAPIASPSPRPTGPRAMPGSIQAWARPWAVPCMTRLRAAWRSGRQATPPRRPVMDETTLTGFLDRGGPALWVIAALSVLTLALILWKIWRLMLTGAWSGAMTERAVALWQHGQATEATALLRPRRSLRARLALAAMEAAQASRWTEAQAREETTRVAKTLLNEARTGLRALELIATIAPLVGLLGTVLGMIAAFQALQTSGSSADPSILAGGIWEALLTTAAGMAVAIPASMALTWFESVADHVQADMEDAATRIFTTPEARP